MFLNDANIDFRIKAIWCKIFNQGTFTSISLEEIENIAIEKQLTVEEIKETTFGYNHDTPCVYIKTNAGSAIFPRIISTEVNLYKENIIPKSNYEKYWQKIDWFMPPYIPNFKLHNAWEENRISPRNIQNHTTFSAQKTFEQALPSIYDFSNIIPITIQTLSQSDSIKKHLPIIKESILSFYSGMKVAAIAALIPIIEDILRSIVGVQTQGLDVHSNIKRCFDQACKNAFKFDIHDANWIPDEYCEIEYLKVNNERIEIIESVRSWLKNSFYIRTDNYQNHSGFNRHYFAHASSDIWQNQYNFFRALGLIQALAFVECFAIRGSRISIFCPTPNEESKSFHVEVLACLHLQAAKKILLNKYQRENELPFNVTASDDGWLLRAAILSEKMNNEVITKLRDKGWQCHSFNEPVEQGEFITIEASKSEKNIKVALLYSFSSPKEVYEHLAIDCDYILSQGAAHNIDEYKLSLRSKVLPLNAWITPD